MCQPYPSYYADTYWTLIKTNVRTGRTIGGDIDCPEDIFLLCERVVQLAVQAQEAWNAHDYCQTDVLIGEIEVRVSDIWAKYAAWSNAQKSTP